MNFKKLNASALIAGVFAAGLAIVAACSSGTTTTVPVEAGVNCGDGSQVCGTTCTVVARDAENCGACGKKCGAGEVCSQGACAASCGGGTTKCGNSCADTKTDGSNCGTCGTKCGAGQVCNAGVCANGCGAGSTVCGNSCVNTQTDQVNCGTCGTLCAGGEQCVAGKCQISCQVGLTLCSTPQSDAGVSDAASDAANDSGAVLGPNYCANLKTDDANCGACGTKCANGQQCVNGSCSTTCGAPNTLCPTDGGAPICANLQSDENNCGGCGKVCPSQFPACVNGICKFKSVPVACDTGSDPVTPTLKYVVCSASSTEAWVSQANSSGGSFRALAICKQLGYGTLANFGGTCGNVCGYCQGATSCSAPGTKTFDGAGNAGQDSTYGQILATTVMWRCTP